MKKTLITCLIFIIVFSNISTVLASECKEEKVTETNSEKKWTYIFYDAHDYTHNWMEPMMFRFITRPWSNKNFNYVVLQDTFYGPGKIFNIKNLGRKVLLENLGEINMGNSSTLEYFVSYCKENFPAERYFLEIASHGTAWYASGLDDTNNHDWLTLEEIQKALTKTGGVDIMAFISSCAMASTESVYELRNLTDVYIGSEEGTAFDFRVYNPIYKLLKYESDLSNIEIGNRIIEIIRDTEKNTKLYPIPRNTMSAIRTDKITNLVDAIGNFTIEISKDLEGHFENIKAVHKKTQLFFDDDLLDIYDFARNYNQIDGLNENLSTFLYDIMQAVNDTVINEYHNELFPGSHGLTLYFPYWGGYQWFVPENHYSKFGLDFANDTIWDEFLVDYDNLFVRVDDDGTADYKTIQQAIDNSSEGDIIYVLNGTYNENIVISKQLILVGKDSNSTIIVGDKIGDTITVTKDGAKLLYFGVCNSSIDGAGIKTSVNSTEIRFCKIYNNNLGVYVEDSSDGRIAGNFILDNKIGVYLSNSQKTHILNNKFKENNKHASFSNSKRNIWDNEYLDRSNKHINIIKGSKNIGKISIPVFRLDRHHIYII